MRVRHNLARVVFETRFGSDSSAESEVGIERHAHVIVKVVTK